MFNDFFNLIFPKICGACKEVLLKNEDILCTKCIIMLPKTNSYLDKSNDINKIFWGRVNIEMVVSYYVFNKKSKVQQLLHSLKYKGIKEVGLVVGQLFGHELKNVEQFNNIDFLVPVPLHKKKLKKRGYNQSEWLAKGLSDSMKIPINTCSLIRLVDSKTQTKKTRYNRWENVDEIFGICNNELDNASVLLVDDVLTTGATIEACAQQLIKRGCKVFVATLASA